MKLQDKLITEDFHRIFSENDINLEGVFNKKILITGASGFFGSWLSELIFYLNSQFNANINLFLIDRDREKFEKNLPHINQAKFVNFLCQDVRSNFELPIDINFIIHGAINPDNRQHASYPVECLSTIANGLVNSLREANRLPNLQGFSFLSSSSIYKKRHNEDAISEEDPINVSTDVKDLFSTGNCFAELLCSASISEYKTPITIIRPFTFCGPYQDLNAPWALNYFIKSAIQSKQISILGTGDNVYRSLMYGADAAIWILKMTLDGNKGKTYNLGNNKPLKIIDIAKKVQDIIYVPIITETGILNNSERNALVPDTTSAIQDFDLKIYTEIDLAIKKTIAWFSSYK